MPPWSARAPSRSSAGCGSRRGNRRTRTPAPRAAAAARRTGGRSTAATVRTVEARARWGATGGRRSVRSQGRVVTRASPGRGGAKTARTKPTQNRSVTRIAGSRRCEDRANETDAEPRDDREDEDKDEDEDDAPGPSWRMARPAARSGRGAAACSRATCARRSTRRPSCTRPRTCARRRTGRRASLCSVARRPRPAVRCSGAGRGLASGGWGEMRRARHGNSRLKKRRREGIDDRDGDDLEILAEQKRGERDWKFKTEKTTKRGHRRPRRRRPGDTC